MLRIDELGVITLTIKGEVIATLDSYGKTPSEIVYWENQARYHHYEINDGFYSFKNERELRELQVNNSIYFGYPLEPAADFALKWHSKREYKIDN